MISKRWARSPSAVKKSKFFSIHDLSFYEDISEVLGVAISHQYAVIELRERIKELTCLSGIARVGATMQFEQGGLRATCRWEAGHGEDMKGE